MQTLVVLTGAGISAESGLATFRDNNGLWCNHRVEDVATPEAFARDPALVHSFYNQRRAQLKEAQPNAAHLALAELATVWPGRFLLVTQNVDDLHERAAALFSLPLREGVRGREHGDIHNSPTLTLPRKGGGNEVPYLIHMHGELTKIRCERCDTVAHWDEDLSVETRCGECKQAACRPHIVWFGEMPLQMELIQHYLRECDVFVSIGTSGNVHPAAGFVQEVRANGKGKCVELNMEPSHGHSLFHERAYGPATQIVPEFVRKLAG